MSTVKEVERSSATYPLLTLRATDVAKAKEELPVMDTGTSQVPPPLRKIPMPSADPPLPVVIIAVPPNPTLDPLRRVRLVG